MRKEFKVGEYYVFSDTKKKAGKATIHALVQVDGELHAVLSYDVGIKRITVLPVEKNENGLTVIRLGCGVFLNSDAPVPPKTVRFQVGKTYFYKNDEFTVTAKYTSPKGRTYLIFEDIYVLEVRTNEYNVEYVQFSNAANEFFILDARNYVED